MGEWKKYKWMQYHDALFSISHISNIYSSFAIIFFVAYKTFQFSKQQYHPNRKILKHLPIIPGSAARLQIWFRSTELRTADSITHNIQNFSLDPVQVFFFISDGNFQKYMRFQAFSLTQFRFWIQFTDPQTYRMSNIIQNLRQIKQKQRRI